MRSSLEHDLRQPECAETFPRAKGCHLVVKADLVADTKIPYAPGGCTEDTDEVMDNVRSVFAEFPRIEDLSIKAYDARTIGKLLQDIPTSAPQLVRLDIACEGWTPWPTMRLIKRYWRIPERVLTRTDRLQELRLQRCIFNWDSQFLGKNLVHFQVTSIEDNARPTTTQLLDALSRMPLLVSLNLQDSTPIVNHVEGIPERFVELPSLRALTLSSTLAQVLNVHRHLRFSSACNTSLQLRGQTLQDFNTMLPKLSDMYSKANKLDDRGVEILALSIDVLERSNYVTMISWPSPFSARRPGNNHFLEGRDRPYPKISITLVWPELVFNELSTNVIGQACRALPLQQLESLSIDGCADVPEEVYKDVLEVLPRLHILRTTPSSQE